jgi:hypothetical protein
MEGSGVALANDFRDFAVGVALMPAEPKIMQTVVHVVREGTFAHCYLQCGHMLTIYEEDFKESDSLIECWACEEEKKTVTITKREAHPANQAARQASPRMKQMDEATASLKDPRLPVK